jgi:hypothetical protein
MATTARAVTTPPRVSILLPRTVAERRATTNCTLVRARQESRRDFATDQEENALRA